MSTSSIVAEQPRYVLTPQGREAMLDEQTCKCSIAVMAGWLYCTKCGTAWNLPRRSASVVNWDKRP